MVAVSISRAGGLAVHHCHVSPRNTLPPVLGGLFNAPASTPSMAGQNMLRLSAELDLTSYSEKPLIASPTNLTPNTRKRTARMVALFSAIHPFRRSSS